MKRVLILIMVALLAGCAGLQTGWLFQMQMQYATPEDRTPASAPAEKAPEKSKVRLIV